MSNVLDGSLYKKQDKQFEKINDLSKHFAGVYCGTTILRSSIFEIVSNYARKNEVELEILRYPFMDEELWAFTFVKKGRLFVCMNSQLILCKQIFAVAHELYHIYCYVEDINQSTITGGSLLNSQIGDEAAVTQEDLEANAFAGLLLMTDKEMREQTDIFGIAGNDITVDNILTLMDLFALPYKATVLRLFEGRIISESTAKELLANSVEYVSERIAVTGKARQWQVDSSDQVYWGSLYDNLEFNSENELLTDSREAADKEYLKEIEKGFREER